MSSGDKVAANDRIAFTRTYLEMTDMPTRASLPAPAGRVALMRCHKPTLAFYRFLYGEVGRNWLWYERLLLDDAALLDLIRRENVEIYVLYVDGCPAGFTELTFDPSGDCEISYFGMMPDFVGGGYGRYLLNWAIDYAWSAKISRLWLHTCTMDSPRALPFYQRAGFRAYHREELEVADPRPIMSQFGLSPDP